MKTVLLHGLGQTRGLERSSPTTINFRCRLKKNFFLQQKMKYHIRRFWAI